jgi:hypothetical protein
MGIFDRVVQDAADETQADPELAQQASQVAGGQAGQDMQAARSMIGRQRGPQDQDQDQDQDGTGQGHAPGTVDRGPDQDPDAGQGQDRNEPR